MLNISVNAPSYKRPDGVLTLNYLPFCRIWVCETEADAYRAANPGALIVPVPEGVQGNLCRIRNWILDQDAAAGVDAVCLIDDDLDHIAYWEDKKRVRVSGFQFYDFLQRHTRLAMDWGVKLWGVNVNNDKQCYREYTPFSTLSYIGGPFSVHVNSPLRYDENLPLKEDYDMTLQHLNKYRQVLRLNKFYYMAKQGGSGTATRQPGGCAVYRNLDTEIAQLEALQRKWGEKIIQYDNCARNHMTTKKKSFDVNPVMRVPIRGV